jgi:hypothetical protein
MKLDNHRTLQHRIHELFLSKIAVTLNYRLLWVVRASRKKIAIAKNREKIAKKSRKNREKIAKKTRKNREKWRSQHRKNANHQKLFQAVDV